MELLPLLQALRLTDIAQIEEQIMLTHQPGTVHHDEFRRRVQVCELLQARIAELKLVQ